MKRLLIGLFLLSICACQNRTVTVVTTRKEEPIQVVALSPADQAVIDEHLKKQAEANATVKHSAAGEILLREGYSFMKLMRDSTSKLYVNCVANGKVICLNLDTGFTNCALAEDVAAKLNLKTTGSNLDIVGAGSERHKTRFGTISEFRVGNSQNASLDVYVTDFSALRTKAKQMSMPVLDGVLGGSWFTSHQCVIDFKRDILYFRNSQTELALMNEGPGKSSFGAALLNEGYVYVKLIKGPNSPELYLKCATNGKPLCFQIDSGADTVPISLETAKRLGLNLTDAKTETAWLGDRPIEAKQTSVSEIKLVDGSDPISLSGVSVLDLTGTRTRAKQIAGVDLDGMLNAQLLSYFSCLLDYRRGGLFILFPQKTLVTALTGAWQARSVKRSGKLDPPELVSTWNFTFSGGNACLQAAMTKWNCQFFAQPNSLNGAINSTLQFSARAEFTEDLFGIFEVDRLTNKLRLCLATDPASRPSRFESTEKNETILIEFERVDPKRPMPPPEK